MEPSPGTLTFSSITPASPSSARSPRKVEHARLSSTSSSSGGHQPTPANGALTLDNLQYNGPAEISEYCLAEEEGESGDEEWTVIPGGGGRWTQKRSSGSVPPSTQGQDDQDELDHHHPHALRPKSRSFHQAGRTSPFKRTASTWKTPTTPTYEQDELNQPTGLPSASLSTFPTSTSTPSYRVQPTPLITTAPANALSASLPGLHPPRQTSLPEPAPDHSTTTETTPPILSPALSFLSAFSSPRSSTLFSASSSSAPVKPTQADDQGQPAGDTPYVLGRHLGQGGSSVVREVLDATTKQKPVPAQAVKIVLHTPKSSSFKPSQARLAQEILLWSAIPPSHPHLVPLLAQSAIPSATFLFMPYMSGGSLFDLVKRHREHDRGRSAMMSSFRGAGAASGGIRMSGMPEGEARRLFRGVVEGLKWLHHEGIVHGDLKAENVLIDGEGRCRLADFGLAVRYRPSPSVVTSPVHLLTHPPTPTTPITPAASTPTSGISTNPPRLHKPKPVYPPVGIGQNHSSGVHRANTISSPHPRLASSPFPQAHYQPVHHHPSHSPRPPSPPTFPPGSLPYAPPELLRPPPHSPPAPSQDIWSLGVLLFFLLTSGSLPFQDAFEPRLQMKIARGVWEMPGDVGVGRQAEELLKGCLEVEVSSRWAVEQTGECEWAQGWEEVKPPRSKSRSRSRQRGGGGPGQAGNGYRDRSHSRGGRSAGGASPRDYHPPSSLLPNPHHYPLQQQHDGMPPSSSHQTSPPTHFSRFHNTSLEPHDTSSRSRSRGRDRSSNRDPSTPSTANTGLSSSPGTPPTMQGVTDFPPLDGTVESKSRSRSRSRRRAGGGMETVPEVTGVEHVERERGRGPRRLY